MLRSNCVFVATRRGQKEPNENGESERESVCVRYNSVLAKSKQEFNKSFYIIGIGSTKLLTISDVYIDGQHSQCYEQI